VLILITGGAASGKSAVAEDLAVSLGERRLYLATLRPFDEECLCRIARHRRMRVGKGFDTLEICNGLPESALNVADCDAALLDSLTNLLSGLWENAADPEGDAWAALEALRLRMKHLVVVSDQISSDAEDCGPETCAFAALLGRLNRRVAARADAVAEVVCGLPIWHKGASLCCKG
jgi:adenosylcobinamide kinase/adenosylcobinamide-phosphate guanylyltransferase